MSAHPDTLGAYRQAVARREPPVEILRAARRCPRLSVDDAMPALLALTTHSSNDLFNRAVDRWIARYADETPDAPDNRELALTRTALLALFGCDATAAIAADALVHRLEQRGLDYARAAVVGWADELP